MATNNSNTFLGVELKTIGGVKFMLRCNNCGNIFDTDEIHWVYESRGEFWGSPAYEEMAYCPFCDSENFDEYRDDDEEDEDEEE